MKKTFAAGTLAAFCFGLWAASALAQPLAPPPPPPPPPPAVGCVAACAPAPGVPDSGNDSEGSSTSATGIEGNRTSEAVCGAKLAHLRSVTAAQIKRVIDAKIIRIVPVCAYKSLAGETAKSQLPTGNVTGLHGALARNKPIAAALGDEAYDAEDVVGVVLAPSQVLIYVHKGT